MQTAQAAATGPIELIDPIEIKPPSPANVVPLTQTAKGPAPSLALSPAALLEIAMQQNDKDLDRLERLLKMAQEWRAEEARVAFNQAMAQFKALNIVVPKTKMVKQKARDGGPGPQFAQSELHVVAGLLQPALSGCGLSHRFDVKFEGTGVNRWISVTCILQHELGHAETITLGGPADTGGSKNPLQEMQSTSTFLQRHALLAITGTAQAGMDNDGRGARGYDEDADAEAHAEEDAPLLQKGRDAAMSGMDALNAWWKGLSDPQRTRLTPEFGPMRVAARKADQTSKGRAAS